jgi:hypothetical protein
VAILNGSNEILGYNYEYQYNLAHNPTDETDDNCMEVSLYLIDLREENDALVVPLDDEGLEEITCEESSICTTIFSRGFNRPCGQLDALFTVQRELTIQY